MLPTPVTPLLIICKRMESLPYKEGPMVDLQPVCHLRFAAFDLNLDLCFPGGAGAS